LEETLIDAKPAGTEKKQMFRRRVEIATAPGEARAVVEDDFHHFRVTVRHDGRRVSRVEGGAVRVPWVTCPLAVDRLHELEGMDLSDRATDVFKRTEATLQCTHMFELAGVAIANAARGVARRRYELAAPVERVGARTHGTLWRDGEQILHWEVDKVGVLAPERFAGLSLKAGFREWIETNLSAEESEAALILRRGVMISAGRSVDLDAVKPGEPYRVPLGGCITLQPDKIGTLKRVVGSTLDFTDRPEALTATDQDWLAFADRP
jgi:Protein of unknown function (DUF2889)